MVFLSSFSFLGGWGVGGGLERICFCCRFFGRLVEFIGGLVRYPVLCLQAINDGQRSAQSREFLLRVRKSPYLISSISSPSCACALSVAVGYVMSCEGHAPGACFKFLAHYRQAYIYMIIQIDVTRVLLLRIACVWLFCMGHGGRGGGAARRGGGGYDRDGLASSRTGKNKPTQKTTNHH